jgi:hypothetical protein
MLSSILWAVIVALVILWLLGVIVVHISSGLIHLLLLAAAIILIYNVIMSGRTRRTL